MNRSDAGLEPARRIVRRGLALSLLGLVGLGGVYVLAIWFTPIEARQGLAQKIFYLHVPAAWIPGSTDSPRPQPT